MYQPVFGTLAIIIYYFRLIFPTAFSLGLMAPRLPVDMKIPLTHHSPLAECYMGERKECRQGVTGM